MKQLTDFQLKILEKAEVNHSSGQREDPPQWRAIIKCSLPKPAQEVSNDTELFLNLDPVNWRNKITQSVKQMENYLKKNLAKKIDWSYTNTTSPNILKSIGFIPFFSHSRSSRSEAEETLKEWEKHYQLPCELYPEMPTTIDLYSYEALQMHLEYRDMVKLEKLPYTGFGGRTPGTIEQCLQDEKKTIVSKARGAVNSAFAALEEQNLAVTLKAKFLCWPADGISLTVSGIAYLEKLKDDATAQSLESREDVLAPDARVLKCLSCAGIYYQINSAYDQDKACTGDMFTLLPKYGPAGSNWDAFTGNDMGEALTCPQCGDRFCDEGHLRDGVLQNYKKASGK